MVKTYDEYYDIISKNPWKISIVPKNFLDYKMLEAVLSQDGAVLEILSVFDLLDLVPDELFELAVQTNGEALAFIPYNKITERMCVNAISAAQGSGKNLKFVPYRFRTHDICKMALDETIDSVFDIPADVMDKDMAIIALQNGVKFRDIPQHLHSINLYEIGITKDGETLSFVPEDLKTREFCYKALEHFGEAFNSIPPEYVDQKFLDILKRHPGKLHFMSYMYSNEID